ncbi:MAG: hypothetical protein QNK18_18415 [Gammaproteobacteria bacterium]|nr:hypothetical protein [Gammaproteobacteria bacterium]
MGRRDKRIQAAVDRLVMEQGSYAPLELCLYMGRLPYARYEAWRSGELDVLEDGLAGNVERGLEELQTAADWAAHLGLVARQEEYRGWGVNAGRVLRFSRSPDGDRLYRTQYLRDTEQEPQMDLFLDSGATPLLKTLTDALVAHRRTAAESCLHDLLGRYPEHRLRPAAEQLCDALAHLESRATLPDPLVELSFLEGRLAPMAAELLGSRRARDFLAPFWKRLARLLEGWPFDPRQDHAHASWAYAKCLDWQAVHDTVTVSDGALGQPILLGRLAEACWRLDRRIDAITHWCRLSWTAPDYASVLFNAPEFPDSALKGAWERFQDLELEPEPVWFPAWLLLKEKGLARALPPDLASDTSAPERSVRILRQLVADSSIAHEEQMTLRRALQAEHPGMLQLFLNWKEGRKSEQFPT